MYFPIKSYELCSSRTTESANLEVWTRLVFAQTVTYCNTSCICMYALYAYILYIIQYIYTRVICTYVIYVTQMHAHYKIIKYYNYYMCAIHTSICIIILTSFILE